MQRLIKTMTTVPCPVCGKNDDSREIKGRCYNCHMRVYLLERRKQARDANKKK
jgi:NMD protein affecting ribosome stability and mRNA decay